MVRVEARPRSYRRDPQGHPRRGFTLVELLIVLTLAGIIAAIALPRIDRTRIQLDSQDKVIRSVLMMAQRLAVTRGYDVVVAFDSVAGDIRVQEDPDFDGRADAGERVTATALEGPLLFGRGSAPPLRAGATSTFGFTERQGALPMFIFHRDGSASEAAVFYLTTRRSTDGAYATDGRAFDLQRATGRVQAYRYDGQNWRRQI